MMTKEIQPTQQSPLADVSGYGGDRWSDPQGSDETEATAGGETQASPLADISGYGGDRWSDPQGSDETEATAGDEAPERPLADVSGYGGERSSSESGSAETEAAAGDETPESPLTDTSGYGGDVSSPPQSSGEAEGTGGNEGSYGRVAGHADEAQQSPAVETQPVAAASAPSETTAAGSQDADKAEEPKKPELRTKPIGAEYVGEEENADFRGNPYVYNKHARTPGARFHSVKTNYFGPQEQAAAAMSVKEGKLMRGGAPIDTRAASGIGTYANGAAGKHIFAMTPDRQMRSIDPWAAHTEEPEEDGYGHKLGMVNHSSLAAVPGANGKIEAGRAAAAGEIAAENGKLTQVTDASGHYKPDNVMTRQALQEFLAQGVDMHDVALKLTDKEGGNNHLHASVREFNEEKNPEKAEENMRDRRAKMRQDLKEARTAFKQRQASGQMNFAGQKVAATPARLDPRTRAPRMKRSQDLIGLFEGMY